MSFLLSWEWKVIKNNIQKENKAEAMNSLRSCVELKIQSIDRNLSRNDLKHVLLVCMQLWVLDPSRMEKDQDAHAGIHFMFFLFFNILTNCITHLGAVVSESAQCGSCGLRRWIYLSYGSVERQCILHKQIVKRVLESPWKLAGNDSTSESLTSLLKPDTWASRFTNWSKNTNTTSLWQTRDNSKC